MRKRMFKQCFLACSFQLCVNVIGLPIMHELFRYTQIKERNINQRYSY